MTKPDPATEEKRRAGEAAAAEAMPGTVIGLGTGSTAAFAIAALGRRVAAGLSIRGVATSHATAALATAAGIPLIDFADRAGVDLAIDGVDEIDPDFRAIKGAGGAMLREKIIAAAATRMIAVADASKLVVRLGATPVPLEVLPFARGAVAREASLLGGATRLRRDATGAAWRSDQGNIVLDCRFARLDDPAALAMQLSAIPGLLGHGLFLHEIDRLYVGSGNGVTRHDRPHLADRHP